MSKRRDPLPRLNIAPNMNSQQPMGTPAQGLYSPALPTSIQQSFHPSFPMNNPLQTPMQSFFTVAPGAPGRPTHHAHQASIQLAAAGILPPNFATPVTSHFPRPSMMLGPGGAPQASSHPYPNRNRRQLSIGGPPKAVLGGPARKVSPLPGAVGASTTPSSSNPAPTKTRKIIVNLPKEAPVGEGDEPPTRPQWARTPLTNEFAYEDIPVPPAEIDTAEIYPPDSYRLNLPNSIDVYLPGKLSWDAIKQRDIEEKLEKLGVERGSGSNIPHIHAPHARAASISSPADPALLLFKLNKLQKAQDASSASNSLNVSPQPPFVNPFGLSPSPRAHLFGNRHGHSMSLAQGPSYQPYSSSPSPFNPFGVNAVLGSDSITESVTSDSSVDPIHAPQGRIPFGPPLSVAGGNGSHVDYSRGFGLEAPLESEEEDQDQAQDQDQEHSPDEEDNNATRNIDLDERFEGDRDMSEVDDGTTTAPQSQLHSRHVSELSAALSLRSVGGNFQSQLQIAADRVEMEEQRAVEADQSEEEEGQQVPEQDVDPVEEWTGSEDVYLGAETSDDESIGEWSNPSDEERARQQRVERRMRRRARQQDVDQPRRLPNFPRPPESALGFLQRREDDIISNPSEENLTLARRAEFLGMTTEEYYPDTTAIRVPQANHFSLPSHSHSRGASSQYSVHDPAMAHSRHSSDNFAYSNSNSSLQHQSNISAGRRDSLNPFAKPFVFGQGPPNSNAWPPVYTSSEPTAPPMPVPVPTGTTSFSPVHARLPSLGKPLNVTAPEFKPSGFNVAAAEFKPGAFNFRLPGAPQMPVAEPAPPPFPVPQHAEPPSVESSPFKVQGREKRQRRLSSSSSVEEGDSMSSFKFPMKLDTSSPNLHRRRRSRSLSSTNDVDLNSAAEPFTFAGFSVVANNMPWMPKESDMLDAINVEENLNDSSTAKGENSELQDDDVLVPAQTKQKRAPIPLDFKHPASGNTVPAGLFKALISSNEDRTRRSVRSRLDSREIFEHSHRPSMDDDNVVLIAQKNPRSRLVTDPGERPTPSADDVFGSVFHSRRRSSLPDALVTNDSPIRASLSPQDLSSRLSLHQLEAVVGQLLDEKFSELRSQIARREQKSEGTALVKAEEMMSLFRVQLQESAVRSLEDSQMDARGDFDFQMLKEVMEDRNRELLASFQQELRQAIENLPTSYESKTDFLPAVQELGQHVIAAVAETMSDLSARHTRSSPVLDQGTIVDKLVSVLSPMMQSLRTEPIDYDFLTSQLTQSVKPHISQLIDLTSDKRETAGLIVERILPHLAALKPVPVDSDAITTQLVTEVRRAIAPIDAFEIKEQVADLVIERLDSRLAVREKANSADVIASKIAESIRPLLDNLNKIPSAIGELANVQKTIDQKQNGLGDVQRQILSSVPDIFNKMETQFDQLKSLQSDALKKLDQSAPAGKPDTNILDIKGIVESLSLEQKKLAGQSADVINESKLISDKLAALPEQFAIITKGVESTLTELITSRDSTKRDLEELRKLNAEYQVQLTKARGSHGQVRVEKDVLAEKLATLEADRDRLRAQNRELQAAASTNATETTALGARNAELEDALAKALARLQSADVVAQTNQRSIADLETSNKDLTAEKQELKSKVDSLDRELRFANAEKETASKALAGLQAKYDVLTSQQSNWEALNAATEKINMVFNLLENADSEEQKELRHYRDHSKVLEDENAAIHKRIKDAESRLANSERSTATLRQTLSQAQQRSEEWERLAKTAQGTVEMLETKLEQAEQTQSQLDADYQFVKMQLDEKDADDRLKQDRETKLQQQITALEAKCVRLQSELEKANATRLSSTAAPFRPRTNGNTLAPRPDSRTSTIYDGRDRVSYSSSRSSVVSPPNGNGHEPSVWDSMHAPLSNNTSKWAQTQASVRTPISRYASLAPATPKASVYVPHPRGPSPTPSTVSAAPTQGDDGWWS
ncbi:hypothetical protein BDN70DRAFT_912709 [Pholiota conissans]|uniref:Uncharacterized protein n=1 Tax=Pholiota conissans TaxID=109636 RepID=A0A9P5Z417_9AGAR|nr:hypothetical protein BDN70DRAFT_912709 [Pholiota conissans]